MALRRHIAPIVLAVGAVVVGYFVYRLGFDNLVAAFRDMGWGMAALLAAPLFLYVVHALGWAQTMSARNRRRAGLLRLTVLQAVSYGIAGMIPLQAFVSEPLKLVFLQHPDYDQDDLAASLVTDNTINGMTIFAWAAGGLVYLSVAMIEVPWQRAAILTPVVLMVAVSVLLVGVQRRGLLSGLLGLLGRVGPLSGFAARHVARAARIDDDVREFYRDNRRGFFLAFFCHLVEKLHGAAEFWLIFTFLGMEVSWGTCFFIFAVVSTLDNLLFFIQLGGMEAWVSSLLRLMGITRDNINITAALFRRVRFLFWAVCALAIVWVGRREIDRRGE